jgi:D-lactate dehydrogenase (cytochrome)
MSGWSLRARQPAGTPEIEIVHDSDRLRPYLDDAAHFPGGHASGLILPASEAAVAAALTGSAAVLPIGAQSSLTGGGTPMGDVLLSTSRMNAIESIGTDTARVQAGVTLVALDDALFAAGRYYPPAPTFTGAFVGGTVATNAAGAATFKYGTTRDWVQALTVILPTGEALDVHRGATRAHPDGYFELELARGTVRVPVPRYTMPALPKLSAGYFAAREMDLIDLFIGSEGTLGVVTAATLRIVAERPAFCLVFVPFDDRARGLQFVDRLRAISLETRLARDPIGIDASAIEHMDERCLALLREDGADLANGVTIPGDAKLALLVTLELPAAAGPEQTFDQIGRAREPEAPDSAIGRFLNLLAESHCASLSDSGSLDHVEIAVPGDRARAAQLLALREAAPAAVNARIGRAQRAVDPRIEKTAADMIVPFDRFSALLDFYDREFARRGLDAAVWGHISDGNVHPNVIPRSWADVESGRAAILAFGREAIRLGGAPLAEHGVGRSRIKQELLRELYGESGIDDMRRVKQALDPKGKLARNVIFEI